MFDHGRGFDLLAPLLADRFRVIAFDARGHGNSQWADSYSWDSDLRDIGNVLHQIGRPVHLVGHSKGGGQATNAASIYSEQVRCIVNLDGFGPPDDFESPHRSGQNATGPQAFAAHLDRARRHARRQRSWRAAASFEELVERRAAQNPRLSREWLHYFLHFAVQQTQDGWRWKADPLSGRGFGPFKVEWIGPAWQTLRTPMLAVAGTEADTWGPLPDAMLRTRLEFAPEVTLAKVEGAGHFVHMEQPEATARLLLDFMDDR
jgi:pimeloyl-ACP methyl ester carboxylesterase